MCNEHWQQKSATYVYYNVCTGELASFFLLTCSVCIKLQSIGCQNWWPSLNISLSSQHTSSPPPTHPPTHHLSIWKWKCQRSFYCPPVELSCFIAEIMMALYLQSTEMWYLNLALVTAWSSVVVFEYLHFISPLPLKEEGIKKIGPCCQKENIILPLFQRVHHYPPYLWEVLAWTSSGNLC